MICVCVVRRGFMCVFKHVVIPVTVSLDCTCNTLLVLSFWIKIRFNTSYLTYGEATSYLLGGEREAKILVAALLSLIPGVSIINWSVRHPPDPLANT